MSKQAFERVRRALKLEVSREPLPSFAWPGGYPIYYLDGGSSTLCPRCANESCEDSIPSFRPAEFGIHYEGESLICDNCSAEIESAYGPVDE